MECKNRVANEINKTIFFSTNADLWSSRTTEPYISLTIHYIDDNWKQQSKCLQTSYFPDVHTGEIIAAVLREALPSWGLEDSRQVCMTTDSGANMVKTLALNRWTRLGCFGHRLHIAIERSVQNEPRLSRDTGVCKRVVSTFSYSFKKQKAPSAQDKLNLPLHKLIMESPTSWGSRLQMMERVLEQEKAITHVLSADKKTRHLAPNYQDIDVFECIMAALKPLQEFTDALSGEAYVSVLYLKPVLHLFKTEVLKSNEGEAQLTRDIKMRVVDYLFDKYTNPETDELLTMATFLDPRFKNTYMTTEKLVEVKVRAASEAEALLVGNTAVEGDYRERDKLPLLQNQPWKLL
ncbi:zinc finger BED domain-containing protein 4-like [Esox lucius]|uniref:zinc finger BED domain-containing protein 4-like n=1 Tax=Esox lucius TaxID=8010 RepID=UPI00147713B8|nr:zinc finger BED domain-containing protein 4-like [Esox lucius]